MPAAERNSTVRKENDTDEMKAKSLFVRALSGIVLVLLMVGLTLAWYDPATGVPGWTFYLLWSAVGVLTLAEYWRLLAGYGGIRTLSAGRRAGWYAAGVLYIAQAFVLIQLMDPMLVVTLLTVVWMADTGAYLVGSTVGRHKMAPRISPGKTWEGFAGGMLFALGTALVWYALYWNPDVSPLYGDQRLIFGAAGETAAGDIGLKLKWAGFGVIVGLAATAGDLLESKFKRTIGVKDSGGIIPGHGGLLDRFDALLLAVPAAWAYLLLTGLPE